MGIENLFLESVIKIQQFADDTTLYLQDENDLETALHVFGSFANNRASEETSTKQKPCGLKDIKAEKTKPTA